MTSDNPDNTSDLTQDLSAVEMLRLVLADVRDMKSRLGAVEDRLGGLEAIVEDRLKDTRPIWQAINQRTERIEAGLGAVEKEIAEVRKDLRQIDRTFSTFAIDHTRMRADIRDFDERLTELERRPN
jgi:septal ring factor EnvC (AmiA/AmiB activator)